MPRGSRDLATASSLGCARLAAIAVLHLRFYTPPRHRLSSMRTRIARRRAKARRPRHRQFGLSHTPKLDNPKERCRRHRRRPEKARLSGHRGLRSRQGRVRRNGPRLRRRPARRRRWACSSTPVMECRSQAITISFPSTRKLTTVSALDIEMVRLELVHQTMEREAKTNLLFFDACRDNPLAHTLARVHGHAIASKLGAGSRPSKAARARSSASRPSRETWPSTARAAIPLLLVRWYGSSERRTTISMPS